MKKLVWGILFVLTCYLFALNNTAGAAAELYGATCYGFKEGICYQNPIIGFCYDSNGNVTTQGCYAKSYNYCKELYGPRSEYRSSYINSSDVQKIVGESGYCGCSDGTYWNNGKTECVVSSGKSNDQICYEQFGANTYGDDEYCYCKTGYEWNAAGTACIVQQNSGNTHPYIYAADYLANLGVIGIQDNPNNYNVYSTITRREMLKIMMNLSDKNVGDACTGIFQDLKASDWGCKYAESAVWNGYIAQNPRFRPDDSVSKIEAIKMIFQARGIAVSQTPNWGDGYVNKGVQLGLFDWFSDYNTPATRGFIFDVAVKSLN